MKDEREIMMQVKDIMTTTVVTIRGSASVAEAVSKISFSRALSRVPPLKHLKG